jgi:PAS domain-containing protein
VEPTTREPTSPNKDSVDFQTRLIKAIYETTPDGILVVDAQGMVVSHNRQFLQLWDIATSQLHMRADEAMYKAKQAERDRVETCA